MKYETVKGLRPCPKCGNMAQLRKNASKRFQVKCKKCNCCTAWTSKTEAVVMWYNNAALYEESMKGVNDHAQQPERTHNGDPQEA